MSATQGPFELQLSSVSDSGTDAGVKGANKLATFSQLELKRYHSEMVLDEVGSRNSNLSDSKLLLKHTHLRMCIEPTVASRFTCAISLKENVKTRGGAFAGCVLITDYLCFPVRSFVSFCACSILSIS